MLNSIKSNMLNHHLYYTARVVLTFTIFFHICISQFVVSVLMNRHMLYSPCGNDLWQCTGELLNCVNCVNCINGVNGVNGIYKKIKVKYNILYGGNGDLPKVFISFIF